MSKILNKDSMSSLLDGLTSSRSTTSEDCHPSNATSKEKPTSVSGRQPVFRTESKERICTSIDMTVMNKVRAISEKEGVRINELLTLGLNMVISKYEEVHGHVRPKKEPHGDINNIFR